MFTIWERICSLYGFLLALYPKAYRDEFGEELQTVFQLSLSDAYRTGFWQASRLVLRELLSLPGAVVHAYLREKWQAHMLTKFGSFFNFTPGSRREVLAALYPFITAGLILPLANLIVRFEILPGLRWLVDPVILVLIGLIGLWLIGGLVTGLPRWSLPYLGFAGALLSVYLFSILIAGLLYVVFSGLLVRATFFGDILLSGVFWFGLLIAMALLVVGSMVSPRFRRFRQDWTLLCFGLYGAIPFVLFLTFDEYVGAEPYKLVAFLALASGAWVYLRSDAPRKRFWALFGALTFALWIAAAGKAILIPSQNWPVPLDTGLVISEVKHTLFDWGWLAIIMSLPLLLRGVAEMDDASRAENSYAD